MSREFARSRRIGEQIQRTLSEILRREIKDPRVRFVSITEVSVSGDLGHAWVYVSPLQPDADPAPVLEGLASAAGYIRHQLGRTLKLRHVPELHFARDDSIARGAKLADMIDDAVGEDRTRRRNADPDG